MDKKNILLGILKLDNFEIHLKPMICMFTCTEYLMFKITYKASNGSN